MRKALLVKFFRELLTNASHGYPRGNNESEYKITGR